MKQLVLASGNPGKLRELSVILDDLGYQLHAQSEFDVPEVAETGTTFVENAIIKARHAAAITGLPALADDSGIEVDALDGAPGFTVLVSPVPTLTMQPTMPCWWKNWQRSHWNSAAHVIAR